MATRQPQALPQGSGAAAGAGARSEVPLRAPAAPGGESPASVYLRDKVNQLLRVIGTWPLRAEALDDQALIALDPIGTIAGAFEQILEHLRETNGALTLARDEIQAVLDCAGAGIIVVDRDLRVCALNALSRQLFFPGGGEVFGKPLAQLNPGTLPPAESEFLTRVVRTRSSVVHADLEHAGRHFQLIGTPVRDHLDRVTRLVLLYADITAREQSEGLLREAEARLSTIFNSVQAGIFIIDPERHVVVDVNESAARMIGVERERVVGRVCHRFMCPDEVGHCPITDLGQQLDRSERVLLTGDGSQVPVLKTVSEVWLGGRRLLLESFVDITERKRAEAALVESEDRYRSLYATMKEGVALHALVSDPSGAPSDYTVVDVNPAYETLLGLPRDRVIGERGTRLYGVGDPPYLETFARVVRTGRPETFEAELHGRLFHVSVVRPSAGHFATLFDDVTARRRAEQEVQRLAYSDTLTGLPNRTRLLERLDEAIARARRDGASVAVLFLDLDRFKPINDTLGHAVGDRLLAAVAERLRTCVRATDTVARVGGDEFVVAIDSVRRDLDVTRVAQDILKRLAEPFVWDGRELFTGISIGIALFPRDGQEPAVLLKNADMAMYEAKHRGRNTYQFFSDEMNRFACERLDLESSLRRALKLGEFALAYQPQVDLARGRVTGLEALVRWDRPGHGPVSPAVFVPVCEESGLILPLGEWVLREACAQARAWHRAGHRDLRVAVNLSGLQLERGDVIGAVTAALEANGVPAGWLELELTESMIMHKGEETVRTLRRLKDLGVWLSIDDFGTGYSSLSYLKKFPIDRIKIAQEFVRDLTTDPGDAAIVEAIIAMAHSLRTAVIAEGVETREQLHFLLSHGCEEMQGYYFSKPLPSAGVGEWIEAWAGVAPGSGMPG
jgi:diguanylate cyclase (GGDEF)-like protein/PAS domain S-box-containing protein